MLPPFASVGMTAFSNYIVQSVVCTLIFYNAGLGLYGSVRPAVGVFLAVAIFIVQIIISHLWLKYFRVEPLEWVWRWLTYWHRQPVRAKRSSTEVTS